MLRKLLYSLFLSFLALGVNSQSNWEVIDQSDGLISKDVEHFIAESESKWWVATDVGISMIDSGQVSNYFINGFDPISDEIYDLEYTMNKLWIGTNLGLFSFDGSNFQLYDTSAGFINASITKLAKESNGTLWIGTNNSASSYDGVTFSIHDSVRATYLEVDKNDIVYAFRYNILFSGSISFNQKFDGNSWQSVSSSGPLFSSGRTIFEDDGEVYLINADTNGTKGYWVISDTAGPSFYDLDYTIEPGGIQAANASLAWTFKDQVLQFVTPSGFYQLQNDKFEFIPLNQVSSNRVEFQNLSCTDQTIFVCSNQGLIYSDFELKEPRRRDTLATNNVRSVVRESNAPFSASENFEANGFGFPKDRDSWTVFSAGLIFVGRDSLSTNFYNTGAPWADLWNAGPASNVFSNSRKYFVKVKKEEIQFHINNHNNPGYQMPKSIMDWPAIGDSSLGVASDLAPFVDVNNNDCYDPHNGDYPFIKGDEAIYWIRHYPDSIMKLELHTLFYAFNDSSTPEINNCQFVDYRLVNRGETNFDSVKIGFFFDGDLGMPIDDYVGSDSLLGISYFYNGDAFDDNFSGQLGYGTNIPSVGMMFLSDSMTNNIYYNIGTGLNGDPATPNHWWNYMNSRWQNGQAVKYGGDGLSSSGVTNQSTTFMFTGDPLTNTGWTEANPGGGQAPNNPGDRRTLSSIHSFSLSAGHSKSIELVMGYGRKDSVNNHLENVEEMKRVLTEARTYWNALNPSTFSYGTNEDCVLAIGIEEFTSPENAVSIYPNPTSGYTIIESERKLDQLQVFSISGKLVRESRINGYSAKLDLSDLNNGLYILRMRSEDGQWFSEKLMVE